MINAVVINSGVREDGSGFKNNDKVNYTIIDVANDFDPDLTPYDLLLTGNPTDHIALYKIKDKLYDFLQAGNALCCFSGWYTNYIPGNRWMMERDIKTIDMRYHKKDDSHALLSGVNIDELIFQNGISGWWACGHIEASPGAEILLTDTLHRPIMVLDETTTKGTIVCTAGGPLNGSRQREDENTHAVNVLYHNIIDYIYKKQHHEQKDRIGI